MDLIIFLVLLFSIICTYTLMARKSRKLPPGPFRYPIIGNILQLGSHPNQSLAKLSQKYGPVMSLKLGGITTIVISSPEAAKDVLRKHDSLLSGKTVPTSAKCLSHHEFSILWQPVRDHWKNLRKICKEHMLSVQRLDTSQGVRGEKLQKLFDYVSECAEKGRAVDLADATSTTSMNLTSAMLFSAEIAQFDSASSQDIKKVIREIFEAWGRPNLADYFPVLKLVDPQGIRRKTDIYIQKLFDMLDGIIDEKLKTRGGPNKDLVDALIEMINRGDESALSINEIKHLLLDLFLAGSDSTAVTVEWAMAELLREPEKICRLREEINDTVGKEGQIQESDISRLPYLQAVVKETLRLHPAGPFLTPHKAEIDVEINGYIVPKNAQILINVWGYGRDSNLWPNADSFIPERFLDPDCAPIDYKGKNFELIPFGSGRRICAGLPLAHRVLHLMVATLVHKFSWRVEEGTDGIDMNENFGQTLQKAIPLKAIPKKL